MSSAGLSQLPPAPPSGCCDDQPAVPAAPVVINNSPGLPSINYRIGTFTSFRRAMLGRVAQIALPDPTTPNPFAGWREGSDGDYHTVLIELWAYLADILTFYQERIANEAYIGTAIQRDSLMRLAQLIDYRPGPGAGASGVVAFTVAKGNVVTLPAGYRVGSRPLSGRPAAVFETSVAITARAEHSAIKPSAAAQTNQFAQISTLGAVFGFVGDVTLALAEDVYRLGRSHLSQDSAIPVCRNSRRIRAAIIEVRRGVAAVRRRSLAAGTVSGALRLRRPIADQALCETGAAVAAWHGAARRRATSNRRAATPARHPLPAIS